MDHSHIDHRAHDHDRGLAFDLSKLVERRQTLKLLAAGAGLVALAGCGSDKKTAAPASTTSARSAASSTTPAGVDASCATIPEETAGPFPGNGSNGPDVLTESGVVRRDIRSSFGDASGVADGVPLTLELTIVDGARGCAARPGAAVYVWHCDREGGYSLYPDGVADQNYLRGVQAASPDGTVTFQTIFPGAYSGRWPHIHFEVYPSLAEATRAGAAVATSQLAFPSGACESVYATSGYGPSRQNFAGTSLASDNVFADGYARQLARVTGNVGSGLIAALTVSL
jgi:protocatechuate 3,4-dioxygenase beta subunit